MLVLSRKSGQKIVVGGGIAISVVEVRGNRVRLGIEAPPHVTILREELDLELARGDSPTRRAPAARPAG